MLEEVEYPHYTWEKWSPKGYYISIRMAYDDPDVPKVIEWLGDPTRVFDRVLYIGPEDFKTGFRRMIELYNEGVMCMYVRMPDLNTGDEVPKIPHPPED